MPQVISPFVTALILRPWHVFSPVHWHWHAPTITVHSPVNLGPFVCDPFTGAPWLFFLCLRGRFLFRFKSFRGNWIRIYFLRRIGACYRWWNLVFGNFTSLAVLAFSVISESVSNSVFSLKVDMFWDYGRKSYCPPHSSILEVLYD